MKNGCVHRWCWAGLPSCSTFSSMPATASTVTSCTSSFADSVSPGVMRRSAAAGADVGDPALSLMRLVGRLVDRLPVHAGAGALSATVVMTAEFVRLAGGGRFAQWLAGLCTALAPQFLAIGMIFVTDIFQPISWLACGLDLGAPGTDEGRALVVGLRRRRRGRFQPAPASI